MALNPIVDSRDQRFVLFELLEIQKLKDKLSKFADYDQETYEEILDLAERIAVDKFYPANKEGDEIGAKHNPDTNEVTLPPSYAPAFDAYYEAGFYGLIEDPEIGGMGMPMSLHTAIGELFSAANSAGMMYPGLSHGAMMLVNNFGTDEQKAKYVDKMMAGEWGGTMCLTEPDAGSDVGALKTKAVKQPDGTYKITGTKIFISAGDNDYFDNIVHPVLARIEGDPAGTKGISIFIVPKYRVNADGTKGEFNDVTCVGIEHKMGIKGSATCTLSFGDNGDCIGEILGEERKGMKIMFHMMNEARLGTGLQGLSCGSTAYMHAITYAKNRIQGVHVTQMLNPEAKGVPIIQHPDVKRMLLWQKSHVEGLRAVTYMLGHYLELEKSLPPEDEERKKAVGMVEILIPICKAGNTDKGTEVCSEAVQTYGGYGYCSDYPVEQFMRDAKITAIYEGTNGIQSIDLTMRKILMNKDQFNYKLMTQQMRDTCNKAKGIVDDKYITAVEKGIDKLDEVIEMLKGNLASGKFLHIFMNATPLQQAMSMLSIAWAHLWALIVAIPKMKELVGDKKGEDLEALLNDNQEAAYYTGRVLSAQFYIGSIFPEFFGRAEGMLANETAVIKASTACFTGALNE